MRYFILSFFFIFSPTLSASPQNLLKAIDDCTRTCSETCEGFAESVHRRLDKYYKACGVTPAVKAGIGGATQARKKAILYKCTAAYSYASVASHSAAKNDSSSKSFDGTGSSLASALAAACKKCGGNKKTISSFFTATETCTMAACVNGSTGNIVPKAEWQNLISGECTRSHMKTLDLRR